MTDDEEEMSYSEYFNVGILDDPPMLASIRQQTLEVLRTQVHNSGLDILPETETVAHWVGSRKFLSYGPETPVLDVKATVQVRRNP